MVRIGFAPGAHAAFDAFSNKVKAGLRRRLREFGKNPAIGKPLIGALQGYYQITYGRIRTVSLRIVVSREDETVLVHVLHIGLRKAGAADDPYEIAAAAFGRQDRDAITLIEELARQFQAGELNDLI